jgi:hypothetical protein
MELYPAAPEIVVVSRTEEVRIPETRKLPGVELPSTTPASKFPRVSCSNTLYVYACPTVSAVVMHPALPPVPSVTDITAEIAEEITQATVAVPLVPPTDGDEPSTGTSAPAEDAVHRYTTEPLEVLKSLELEDVQLRVFAETPPEELVNEAPEGEALSTVTVALPPSEPDWPVQLVTVAVVA